MLATLTNRLPPPSARNVFWTLLSAMVLLYALCWPVERSLDLWVFKDRGSLLNLDAMLDQHLQLGVDTFYCYGLLTVLVQRTLFQLFGRGSWPLIGFHFVYVALMAAAWTMIVRQLRQPLLWEIVVILLVPIILWVNPNLPYVLVQLSMMFGLALALKGNLRTALAVSAIGCWSVPTITLVFSAALLALLCLQWRASPNRSVRSLAYMLAPGAAAYIGLGLILTAYFGWRSVLATALPLQGMMFYKSMHFGMFTSLKAFLHPAVASFWKWSMVRYYVCDRATWWVVGTLILFGLAASVLVRSIKQRALPAKDEVVVLLCAIIHLSFITLAYGSPTQHVIYDLIIVAGVIVGLSRLAAGALRDGLLCGFMAVSLLSHINQVGYISWLWQTTHPSPQMANFYAMDDFKREWSDVLQLSTTHKLFMLAYSTGMQNYFPTVEVPPIWTVQLGEVFDGDKARLLEGMHGAEVVVEDTTGPTALFEMDQDIKSELSAMCLVSIGTYFITWTRTPFTPDGECRSFHRELPSLLPQRNDNAT